MMTDRARMTDAETKQLEAFDRFLAEQQLDVESFTSLLADAWRRQALKEPDRTVASCLISAAENIEQAGMDWYVSTK